jgi:serine O-acetyltransferase
MSNTEKTVQALLEHYEVTSEDDPRNVLGALPNPTHITEALQALIDVVLPGRFSHGDCRKDELECFLRARLTRAEELLSSEIALAIPFRWEGRAVKDAKTKVAKVDPVKEAARIIEMFFSNIAHVREFIVDDVIAAYKGDPAALTFAEVMLSFPGLLAITSHRIAHEFYKLDVPIVPRVMSEWTHTQTGVDIHPGAQIGRGVFIDHATGVVIGETTVIGDNVKIYQGVTLGAKSFPLDENGLPIKHIKRHPTVEDNVVIYANAAILGGDTVIGAGSTIGGNVFLMQSVSPNSYVGNKNREVFIKES